MLDTLLAQLENYGSADAIAQYLFNVGIRGKLGDACNCPVANWLSYCTDQPITVGATVARVTDDSGRAAMPFCVKKFVKDFDSGSYGFLHG